MRRPPSTAFSSTSITRKPPGLDDRCKFDVSDMGLANEDTWDELLDIFAAVPASQRERLFWAFELAMASPTTARVEFLRELKPRMSPASPAMARRHA